MFHEHKIGFLTELKSLESSNPKPRKNISSFLLTSIASELSQSAEEYDKLGKFPAKNIRFVHRHKLLSLTVPEEFGGSDQAAEATDRGESPAGQEAGLLKHLVTKNVIAVAELAIALIRNP